jgi:hypothetical protein
MANDDASTISFGGMKLPTYLFTMCSRRYVFVFTTLILLLFFAFSDSFQVRSRVIDAATNVGALRPFDNLDLIANGTLGFGAIFAIGLPDRHDKRDITTLAAAVTGLQLTWVDGVPGDTMNPKATPPIHFDPNFQDRQGEGMPNDGQVGCWRSHLNIWREMVNKGIESALIIEDDADWDVRIVQQMQQFAVAAKEFLNKKEIRPPKNAASAAMLDSPYGEDWEILFPGHCGGMVHPDPNIRNIHTLIRNDTTMPPTWDMHDLTIWLDREQFLDTPCYTHAGRDAPGRTCDQPRIPSDARIVQLGSPMCTMGYAISQKGARHFLATSGGVSLLDANNPVDQKLMEVCRGEHDHDDSKVRCVSVSPPYIESHRPRGIKSAESDIIAFGSELREDGVSQGLVLSAKINIKNLVAGREPESQYVQDAGSSEWRYKRLDEYTEQ